MSDQASKLALAIFIGWATVYNAMTMRDVLDEIRKHQAKRHEPADRILRTVVRILCAFIALGAAIAVGLLASAFNSLLP